MRIVLVAALALAGCRGAAPAASPRWMIARRDGGALQRGFGVQIVEARGERGRTADGRWFPLAALEPAQPLVGSAAAPAPRSIAPPTGVGARDRWIDVDVAAQRLTAYEGARAVRTVKVSSGVGEDGAPYSTPRGTFRIYAKLRAATMASEAPPPGAPPEPHPYRFEAVPDVQYFNREVALHGAYWHRRFGERVSHGCVNLAPADAAWLFEFTEPHLADGERERATTPDRPGTIVRVR